MIPQISSVARARIGMYPASKAFTQNFSEVLKDVAIGTDFAIIDDLSPPGLIDIRLVSIKEAQIVAITFPETYEKAIDAKLVEQAKNRIEIMPGGGLRSSNISELNQIVNTNWYHSSAITDGSEIASSEEIMQLKNKLQF